MMPPRHCPSYAIGTWEQNQDWQRSGEPLRFAQSLQRQRWQCEAVESGQTDLPQAVARAAFCPGCYLKTDSCTVTQAASILGLARALCISKTTHCSAVSHWAQNINDKQRQTDWSRNYFGPFTAFNFFLHDVHISVLKERERRKGRFIYRKLNSFKKFNSRNNLNWKLYIHVTFRCRVCKLIKYYLCHKRES